MTVYDIVTLRILKLLEQGRIPWEEPWFNRDRCINYIRRKPYSPLNELILGQPGEYLTMNQANKNNGKVKKGSNSRIVTFWNMAKINQKDSNGKIIKDSSGKPKKKTIPLLKYYRVFHIDDVEGLDSKLENKDNAEKIIKGNFKTLLPYLQRYAKGFGFSFNIDKSTRPGFNKNTGVISMPSPKTYKQETDFLRDLLHVIITTTGSLKEMTRYTGPAPGRYEDDPLEYLIGDIGACMLMRKFNIAPTQTYQRTTASLQRYGDFFESNKKAIVTASSRASKAAELVLNLA